MTINSSWRDNSCLIISAHQRSVGFVPAPSFLLCHLHFTSNRAVFTSTEAIGLPYKNKQSYTASQGIHQIL